jgi:acyl carrier protein
MVTGTRAPVVTDRPLAAPRTVQESQVLSVFQEILGHENIGIHDDFFALGGHSLLAIRLIGRLSQRLGVNLDLRWLFRTPTVAGLCAALDAVPGEASAVAAFEEYLLPVREVGVGRPIFFVPGGDGDVLAMDVYGRSRTMCRPLARSTRIDGAACVAAEREAGCRVITAIKHSADMTSDLAGGCIGGIIAFETASLLRGDEVRRRCWWTPFSEHPAKCERWFAAGARASVFICNPFCLNPVCLTGWACAMISFAAPQSSGCSARMASS